MGAPGACAPPKFAPPPSNSITIGVGTGGWEHPGHVPPQSLPSHPAIAITIGVGTGGWEHPEHVPSQSFHKLLYILLIKLCVVSNCPPPQSKIFPMPRSLDINVKARKEPGNNSAGRETLVSFPDPRYGTRMRGLAEGPGTRLQKHLLCAYK